MFNMRVTFGSCELFLEGVDALSEIVAILSELPLPRLLKSENLSGPSSPPLTLPMVPLEMVLEPFGDLTDPGGCGAGKGG